MKKILVFAAAVLMLTACRPDMRKAGRIVQASVPDTVKTVETADLPSEKAVQVFGHADVSTYVDVFAVRVTDHNGRNHTVVVVKNSAADGGVAVCELRDPEDPAQTEPNM